MKRETLIVVALCLVLMTIVGGGASGSAGALSSFPGYADALAAANGTTLETTPSGSLRSLPGYQYVLNNSREIPGTPPSGSFRNLPGYQDALDQWKGMPGAAVYPGTIQRASEAFCYNLTYLDASQAYITVYLPANEITCADGSALPTTIPDPVEVDYVGPIDYYHHTLDFRYQGVYYSAKWYTSCPYDAPVITVTGTYSPYRVFDGWYYWYWNLHMVTTWDASNLPAGVELQRISWSIYGTTYGRTDQLVYRYTERRPAEFGFPAYELPVVSSDTINDGYTDIGCISPDLCPSDTWATGPLFTGSCTITTTDGNSYTTTTTLSPA